MLDIVDEELDEHREDRTHKGHKASWNAMVRLDVQEVSPLELPSELEQTFSKMEISLSNVNVWRV